MKNAKALILSMVASAMVIIPKVASATTAPDPNHITSHKGTVYQVITTVTVNTDGSESFSPSSRTDTMDIWDDSDGNVWFNNCHDNSWQGYPIWFWP